MTGITQKIPNYIGGISQQPDELMPLGSVRDALNVIPDVTNGLSKRPGGRLLNPLPTVEGGTWFHIHRDSEEQYLGHVKYNGSVEVYDLRNGGVAVPVNYETRPFDPYYMEVDDDDEFIETVKPACNWAVAQEELFKITELDVQIAQLEAEVTILVDEQNRDVPNEEEQTFYDVEKVTYEGYKKHYVLYEGKVKGDGKDFEIPDRDDLPKGWKRKFGERRVKNATVFDARTDRGENSGKDGGLTRDPYRRYKRPTRKADIYPVIWYKPGKKINNRPEINNKRDEINALKEQREVHIRSYAQELDNCDLPSPDFIEYRTSAFSDDALNVMPYMVHDEDQGLKVLTINDFTFFANPDPNNTNPNSTPIVDRISGETRPYENFIELTNVAINKEYTLYLQEAGDTGNQWQTRVTDIDVANVDDGTWEDSDGSCAYTATEEFTISGNDLTKVAGGDRSDRVNLIIRLTTSGVQFLPENKDGTDPNHYNCKYRTSIDILNSGAGFRSGDQFKVTMAGRSYVMRINDTDRYSVNNVTAVIRPEVITGDGATVPKAEEILQKIQAAIEAYDPTYTTQIIGNGVYVARTKDDNENHFTFSTPEKQLMNITTDEVNNITDLPTQCKEGYIVRIANTDSDFDDYWAKFVTATKGVDGTGAWEETRIPGGYHSINVRRMPHVMRRRSDGEFVVSPFEWSNREVGDDNTNPPPSFIGQKINNIILFRNRLGLLSDENVILSQAGKFSNFWNGSALAQVDNDPIDISAASTKPAVLYEAIEVGEGLLCFSQNQQHLLSTDSEVFGPNTARFNLVGTYRFSRDAGVFSLGSTVAFMNNSGLYSRAIEMTDISRSKQSKTVELSKPVSQLMPSNLNRIADSQDNNFAMYSTKNSRDIWVYRYFDDDGERRQSAWFRWNIPGLMLYHFIIEDVYYTVSWSYSDSFIGGNKVIACQRYDLKDTLSTSLVGKSYDDTETKFEAHLDNYRIAFPGDLQYYEHIDRTYFKAPIIYYNDRKLVAYALSANVPQEESGVEFNLIGSAIEITVEQDSLGTWYTLPGDWSYSRLMIGYEYEMKVEFPTIYPTKTSSTLTSRTTITDTRSDLTIHRVKLNFGQTGVYNAKLTRFGREDYEEMYECKTMDSYVANEVAFDQRKTQTVPVYARNKDFILTLTSSHPSPATLHSMEWEGDYNTYYYKRA